MRCGADPEQLSDLAAALRVAARSIDDVAVRSDRRLRTSGWSGPDARRFDTHWRAARGDLVRAADACRTQAGRLDRHAREQRAASRPDATGSTASALPLARPAPSEVRYVGGVDLRVGPVLATIAGDLTVASLGDGRTRVVLAESVGAGTTLSAGASASISVADEVAAPVAASDGTADARLRLGAVHRRTWEVDDRDVDDLLAGVAMERIDRATPLPAGLARTAAGLLDRATDHLTGIDPGVADDLEDLLTPPRPERTETLVEVDVAASAAVALGAAAVTGRSRPLGGSAATTGALRAGTARIGDGPEARTSRVIEWSGTTNAALTSTLAARLGVNFPDPYRSTATVRLELGAAPDGSRQLDARLTAISGSHVDEVALRVELADGAPGTPGAVASELFGRLARGDTAAALGALEHLEIHPESLEVVTSSGTVSGTSGRAGASGGIGPGVGATVRGQQIRIDRGPTIGG